MKTFKLVIEKEYFKMKDVLETPGEVQVRIVSTPKMHLWQRFKKFLGLNYSIHYKVKLIENEGKSKV